MQSFPHRYVVRASGAPEDNILVQSERLDTLTTAPPAQFGGPGDLWSPEELLAAAVADCFILTFKAAARVSNFGWHSLTCEVEAILDRPEKILFFTEFRQCAELHVPVGTDEAKALKLLEKAEHGCLITNSLKSEVSLDAKVVFSQ